MINPTSQRFAIVCATLVLVVACEPPSPTDRSATDQPATTKAAATLADDRPPPFAPPPELADDERLITLLGSNDMHGGAGMMAVGSGTRKGQLYGGLAIWSGVAAAIREGVAARYGERGGVLLIDAGDQFQGTLLSNSDQGDLMYDAMNLMNYDVAIPGNHGFDFGPISEMDLATGDFKVVDPKGPNNHLGALTRLADKAHFPILSANTYLRNSLVDADGNPVEVKQVGCAPTGDATIDFSRARRPNALGSYVIREVADVRVAVIGIDHHESSLTTKAENVADLCFRDEVETIKDVRREIGDQADVFVLLIHNGNSKNDFSLTEIVGKLTDGNVDLVDAVIAGHTHFTNNVMVNGVAALQSGSSTRRFGRIDLVWNASERRIEKDRTRWLGGISLWPAACDLGLDTLCEVLDQAVATVDGVELRVAYEGIPVVPDPAIVERIAKARERLAVLADQTLGTATATLESNRIAESPLADRLTDALLKTARSHPLSAQDPVDVAAMNTGGMRKPIQPGTVKYEDFFAVLPFENEAVVVDCGAEQLVALMQNAIDTCGEHGALIAAGLEVEFRRRNCSIDPGAGNRSELVSITAEDGTVLFPATGSPDRRYQVATLDFLASGGSGYSAFGQCKSLGTIGNMRQALVKIFRDQPFTWSAEMDGRFRDVSDAAP